MTRSTSSSVIIVGSGIVGLCLAVAAQARGHAVTMIARDTIHDTASGVAAGMIAPALEALGEHEPEVAYARLNEAQGAWHDLMPVWPQALSAAIRDAQAASFSRYVWPQSDNSSDLTTPRLKAMDIAFSALSDEQLIDVAADMDGVALGGDWLLGASATLEALREGFLACGGVIRYASVASVAATSVTLDSGETLTSDHVVIAAGYGSAGLANDVPALACLVPVKGHLLDLNGQGRAGVVRSSGGYLADYGTSSKFGATMQFGQSDLTVEHGVTEGLKSRAAAILPDIDLSAAVARVGVRAATPDSWPLIGRDKASGVLVATGMRRNGYIFAPCAALVVLALIEGRPAPEGGGRYDPNRFLSAN